MADGLILDEIDYKIKNIDLKIENVENSMSEGVSKSFCGAAYISF